MTTPIELLRKYNQAVPRYTSYPTLPDWHNKPSAEQWGKLAVKALSESGEEGVSLYLHLPYCQSLCTYCACNKRITANHKVELPYIETLLQEWRLYREALPQGFKPLLRELHLGGGTPTFFSPENLFYLLSNLLVDFQLPDKPDWSFEAHPANTSEGHLQVLYNLGFRRLSLGIQDFDIEVQTLINRFQTVEQVAELTALAREIGYESVNFDLIYGLPHQTPQSMQATLQAVKNMRPDRIAFYSYAHVPWTSPGQRRYTEADLPAEAEKRALYELGHAFFLGQGYEDLGMDHFALPDEALSVARRQGNMHRNFMGYTTQNTSVLLGLGASSISDTWGAFAQNLKTVETWREAVESGQFPIDKGHILDKEDLLLRPLVLELMCQERLTWPLTLSAHPQLLQARKIWEQMAQEGLLHLEETSLEILPLGRPFLRNIASALDPYYRKRQVNQGTQNLFSKAI